MDSDHQAEREEGGSRKFQSVVRSIFLPKPVNTMSEQYRNRFSELNYDLVLRKCTFYDDSMIISPKAAKKWFDIKIKSNSSLLRYLMVTFHCGTLEVTYCVAKQV